VELSHVECKLLGASSSSTTTPCTTSLLLESTHTSKWTCSSAATAAHETREATIVHASHLLTHEHLEQIIWVKSHSSTSTTWHPIEAELHSTRHTTEPTGAHSILHVVCAEAHVVLFPLLWIRKDGHGLVNLFELFIGFGLLLLVTRAMPVWMPFSG